MPPFLYLLILDDRLRKRRTATAIALFAIIVMIGSIPGARAEIGTLASGIVLHAVAYAVLTFLLFTLHDQLLWLGVFRLCVTLPRTTSGKRRDVERRSG